MRFKYVEIVRNPPELAAEKWRQMYPNRVDQYKQLLALGKSPTAEEVVRLTGDQAWTSVRCDSCKDYVKTAVAIGGDESRNYCPLCIAEAMEVLSHA